MIKNSVISIESGFKMFSFVFTADLAQKGQQAFQRCESPRSIYNSLLRNASARNRSLLRTQ
jgi:hypothetical protein